MSLPISSDRTQAGCNPVSSNCVIWQGPDIPCLGLCQGDSISDVTAKLAQKLCDLLDQVDISTFDLTCFNPVCPTLTNFHDLVQFIIDKLCAQQTTLDTCCGADGTGGSSLRVRAGTDCPDCIVDVASCFYTTNEFGDVITQMLLSDYARAIGARVCVQVNEIFNINIVLSQQQTQIVNIQSQLDAIPAPVSLPIFLTTCLTDKFPSIPVTGIPIADLVGKLQEAFCELRTATGMPSALLSSILQQCVNLDSSPALNQLGVNMGSLPGWKVAANYSTVADSINNMWISICDLRAAVTTIQNTCCPQGCDGLIIQLQVTLVSTTLNLFWSGGASGFSDCNPAGSLIVITDAYGNSFTTYVPIVAYVNGGAYAIQLAGSPLNLATNLSITIQACFRNTNGDTCERCIEASIINQSICPTLTLDASATVITYSFSNAISGSVQYDVILKQGATLIDQHTIVTNVAGPIVGSFSSGILPGTIYNVSIQITINGAITNTCPVGVITTEDLNCNPPTEVSAQADPPIVT